MTLPKISIVTPCFNAEKHLESTLRSVLDQGYPNLEYIVMDGGSSDATAQILQRYAPELHFWVSEKDAGQYDAINRGFTKATGDVLCWLNADDMLLPKSLFVVGEIFAQLPQVEWLSTLQPGSFDANGYLARITHLPGFSKAAFLDGLYLPTTAKKGYWLQQESTFWRRSLWEKIGQQIPSYQLAGDFALWCKFYEHAQLYGVQYPLAGFRMIEGQRSEDITLYMQEASAALSQLRKESRWAPAQTPAILYGSLSQIPLLKDWLRTKLGYQGKLISKTMERSSDAKWRASTHSFLP